MISLVKKILLLALIASAFVSLLHSPLEHVHDHTCGVYILEEIFISGLPEIFIKLLTVAIGFIYILNLVYRNSSEPIILFAVRAPPSELYC